MTFTLPGSLRTCAKGIVLVAGFTANVEGELRVGSIEETITVTGASPVVDVTNVRRQTVVTNELLETLPTSTKSVGQLTTLTTGLTGLGDVGGSYQVEPGQDVVSGGGRFHGKSGTKVSYDGMGMENSSGNSSYQLNAASVEEMVMSTSGISADTNADGLVVNIVPKEGSNNFRVTLAGLFADRASRAPISTTSCEARGLQTPNKTIKLFDESASIGGPIKRDRSGSSSRRAVGGSREARPGTYWNKTQNVFLTPPGAERKVVLWTPWMDRPDDRLGGRLEWYDSVSDADHVSSDSEQQDQLHLRRTARVQLWLGQRAPVARGTTARVPVRAQSVVAGDVELPDDEPPAARSRRRRDDLAMEYVLSAGCDQRHHPVNDIGIGQRYGARDLHRTSQQPRPVYAARVVVVRDRIAQLQDRISKRAAHHEHLFKANGNVSYTFRNGDPIQSRSAPLPIFPSARQVRPGHLRTGSMAGDEQADAEPRHTLGLLQQLRALANRRLRRRDRRLLGRFADHQPVDRAAYVRPVNSVPNWKDCNPRLGASYDLFGNGKRPSRCRSAATRRNSAPRSPKRRIRSTRR